MNHDRISVVAERHARGIKVLVSLDGVQLGAVPVAHGWAPDLMDALDDGTLRMTDFDQVAEERDSIRAVETELRRRIDARARGGPLFDPPAEKGPTP